MDWNFLDMRGRDMHTRWKNYYPWLFLLPIDKFGC